MTWEKVLISLIPIPLFYLIYFRYFTFKAEYAKHLQSFLSGVALAIFLSLIAQLIDLKIVFEGALSTAFLKAALVEKVGAFIVIYFIQRKYANFNIMEATASGMLVGIGFSSVENVFYAAQGGSSILIVRILFSVPLHLTTCGMMGYYLGMMKQCETGMFKFHFALKAAFFPILLHGTFDTILITGGTVAYLASPMLILMVVVLEFLFARSQTIIPWNILKAMKLRFEDWLLIDRQPRYERWILRSMGTVNSNPVHLFLWRPGIIRFFLVILFMGIALVGMAYQKDIIGFLKLANLKPAEQVVFLGVFPSSISVIIILVGAINPDFFRKSEIRIPIITDVEVYREQNPEETLVTYDITSTSCFLRTSEGIGIGREVQMVFECSRFASKEIRGVVVWENHVNRQEAIGTVVKLVEPPFSFSRFFIRYYAFRYRKGFIFLLKLPGFETTRKFFMRPISTMQEEMILKSGAKIFNEGDVGNEFYLLKKGRVLFYKTKADGTIITMDTVVSGQVFGEMALVGSTGRAATAICLSDCIVAKADKDNMNALIISNIDFARTLIQTLTERIELSEKILVENIRLLEMQKKEGERIFHVAALLILVGLGYSSAENKLHEDITLEKISEVVKNLDEDSTAEMFNLIKIKQEMTQDTDSERDEVQETVAKAFHQLYERFKAISIDKEEMNAYE
ncbi:MAG: cyclic nucleotide-binding domain-containing protein [bacterium]|nr:cyclic nucleotide-binding domain-containing protein [bacterium]